MPHTQFLCPDPAMWDLGADNQLIKTVDIPDCLNCSLTRVDRDCHWDFADLAMRIENGYDESFSPSRFNGCDRELYLRANFNFWTDPAEQTYRVRGTSAHAALEVAPGERRVISEARVYRALRGAVDHLGRPVVVGVKPDAVYPDTGLIADFKTWKYLPRGNVERGKVDPQPVKPAVLRQLSIGAWAWADPIGVQYRGDSHTTLRPEPIELVKGQESLRDGHSYLRQVVELMDFAELEDWMRGRVAQLNALRLGHEPGYCAEDLRWKCGNCPVRYLCGIPKELYAKPKTPKEKKPSAKQPARSRSRRSA